MNNQAPISGGKTEKFYQKKISKVFLVIAAVLTGLMGAYIVFYSNAATACNIAPANDTLAIERAINSCPDGSTILFPLGTSYSLNDTIFVKDRNNLIIDGRGSTFTITTDGLTKPSLQRLRPDLGNAYDCSKNGGNWMLLRGTNITLKNMKAIGSFPPGLNGEVRDISKENRPEYLQEYKNVCSSNPNFAWKRYTEAMSNFGVYGTNGASLQDLSGFAPWGDTFTAATDLYVDNYDHKYGGETRSENGVTLNTGNYARNVTVNNVDSEDASRMCYAITSGRTITVQDSHCKSAWYGATDQEIDNVQQPLENVHFLRNTFDEFQLFGYLLPVAGTNTRDISVKGNTFLTPPDRQCNYTIGMGGYEGILETIKNVSIENNTMVTYGTAITLDSIAGGTVKNNKITTLPGGGCGNGDGSAAALIKVSSRSTNVVQENNGPNAPGAGGTVSPAPAPPPAPSPAPAPAPTPAPTPGSCPAPVNFRAASPAAPAGSGQYNLTWDVVAGATYSLRFGNPPEAVYAERFDTNSATAYSLGLDKPYNFAVRAHCANGSVSANSNVLTITAPSSSDAPANSPPPAPAPATKNTLTTNQTLKTNQQLVSGKGHKLVLQGDGNLVLYNAQNKALWHTVTHGTTANRLVLQGDGNLVLYNAQNKALWHTVTWGL